MGRFHRHDDGTEHEHDDGTDHGPGDRTGQGPEWQVGDHTAYRTGVDRISVLERIFGENDAAAAANRRALDAAGVRCVNLMSSPGAGKTALLVHTLAHLRSEGIRAGVVVGDIETALDADRLSGAGAQISLVNTGHGFGGECHLDAPMVARGLASLDLHELDLVLVENVGNLVCPAEFDIGAHHRVMVSAVTEGEEKPLKYPVMFRSVELVLVNKIDLLPYLDVDLALFETNLRAVNPRCDLIHVSARSGEGLADWYTWLAGRDGRHP
ncbi:MAG TPA: hydrogenase nickel incorporation protein HypB [Candidatus Lustribacter sp.]|nr:hydrogenase nickel incorporation protein HypB [Candidatus Lustribacter sp.]